MSRETVTTNQQNHQNTNINTGLPNREEITTNVPATTKTINKKRQNERKSKQKELTTKIIELIFMI